jgi:hypothetical protein
MKKTWQRSKSLIDVRGIPKGMLFAGLFNGAKDTGDPRKHRNYGEDIGSREGDAVLAQMKDGFVGYYGRRVISIQFNGNFINPLSYDKHNGKGRAAEVVKKLREKLDSEGGERC